MHRMNKLKFDKKADSTKPRKSSYKLDGYPTTIEECWDTIRRLQHQLDDQEKRVTDALKLLENHHMQLINMGAEVEQLKFKVCSDDREEASETREENEEEWVDRPENFTLPQKELHMSDIIVIDDEEFVPDAQPRPKDMYVDQNDSNDVETIEQ